MVVGLLDLRNMFTSAVTVLDVNEQVVAIGKLPFFGPWTVADETDAVLGEVRHELALFVKRYIYDAAERGRYEISAPVMTYEFTVTDDEGTEVARFEQTAGAFMGPVAYQLTNQSDVLGTAELVIVMMGVHAIQERNQWRR